MFLFRESGPDAQDRVTVATRAARATTPVAATARTDLSGAHDTLATLHGRRRRAENPLLPT